MEHCVNQAQHNNANSSHLTPISPRRISGRVGLRLVMLAKSCTPPTLTGLVITQLSLSRDIQPAAGSASASDANSVPVFNLPSMPMTGRHSKIATGKLQHRQPDRRDHRDYKLKSIFTTKPTALPNQFVNVHLLVDTKRNLIIVLLPPFTRPQGTYVYARQRQHRKIPPSPLRRPPANSVG